jgi:CRISPR/Cas system CSM-associated protein Csm3 (group 7 of RAMP superfamily)
MSEVLQIHLKGGLLLGVGGHAGLHDTTLRDSEGVPFLPTSAVKGAIREQLIRLEQEKGQTVRILGGPGHGPLPSTPDQKAAPEAPVGGQGLVYLEDAFLANRALKEWFKIGQGYAVKPQVSIHRRSGRSRDHHLFQREILAPFAEEVNFRATLDTSRLQPEDRRVFRAAVHAVFAIGGGRTSGLGGVEMKLLPSAEGQGLTEETPPGEKAGEAAPAWTIVPEIEAVELVLQAIDPLCVGVDQSLGNFRRTLGHLPASSLRGALVTAALEVRGEAGRDQSDVPWFRRTVLDPSTCLHLGDALPEGVGARQGPFSIRLCKARGAEHGLYDTLTRDYLLGLLRLRGLYVAPAENCPLCAEAERQERLIPADHLLGSQDPIRRVVTRLGLDPKSGCGADGQLFSLEVLERGSRFLAPVTGLDAEGRRLLEDAARGVVRIGHGRGQGYGRLRLVEIRLRREDSLVSRLEAFDRRLRQDLQALARALGEELGEEPGILGGSTLGGSTLGAASHFLAITLLSDLVPSDPSQGPETALLKDLQLAGTTVVAGQVRTGQRGGWDSRSNRQKVYRPILRAGSALLLRSPRPLAELEERLMELETHGAGAQREEGFGWLRASDPIHLSTRSL